MSKGEASSNTKIREKTMIVFGSPSVGKSSVSIQFCENHFTEMYNPTISNKFEKTLDYRGTKYRINILDTAGQSEYDIMPRRWMSDSPVDGYIMMFAINSKSTFEILEEIRDKMLETMQYYRDIPCILVGNKSDLPRQVDESAGNELAKTWNCQYLECSAKLNRNITDVFCRLIDVIDSDYFVRREKCLIL